MGPAVHRKPGATYQDLLSLPDHVVGEIIAGDLFVSPRPSARHAVAASVLGGELMGPFHRGKGPGGWWILDEPELHLALDVLVPDLAGWRRERMPQIPDTTFFELPPDWACEVLSPSTAHLDRTKKLRVYAKSGVPHVWLIDPSARTIEVFGLVGDLYTLRTVAGESPRARLEPFDAIELEIEALWLPDEAPTTT